MSELVEVEFVEEIAGMYFRSYLIRQAGVRVPQHDHPYDHATYCGSGSAAVFVDGYHKDIISAGEAYLIKAHQKHEFESLVPNTRLTCVHDTRSAEFIKKAGL